MDQPKAWRSRDQTVFARQLRRDVSKTERRLWPHLRSGQLGVPFRRQHVIGEDYVDYCCVPLQLVIEIDGPMHALKRDAMRDRRLAMAGYEVLRFSVQEVDENLDGIVRTIHQAVQLRLLEKQVRSKK